jgi:CheY-like chemotaxis protein
MKTILVLEDDPSVMKLLCHLLKQYSLIEATGAEQALRLFLEHDRRIDLLVADVTLPKSSGIKVALILRSEVRRLPVILTSGYPVNGWNTMDSADLSRLGTSWLAVLQKPFEAEELLNTVREFAESKPSKAATTA